MPKKYNFFQSKESNIHQVAINSLEHARKDLGEIKSLFKTAEKDLQKLDSTYKAKKEEKKRANKKLNSMKKSKKSIKNEEISTDMVTNDELLKRVKHKYPTHMEIAGHDSRLIAGLVNIEYENIKKERHMLEKKLKVVNNKIIEKNEKILSLSHQKNELDEKIEQMDQMISCLAIVKGIFKSTINEAETTTNRYLQHYLIQRAYLLSIIQLESYSNHYPPYRNTYRKLTDNLKIHLNNIELQNSKFGTGTAIGLILCTIVIGLIMLRENETSYKFAGLVFTLIGLSTAGNLIYHGMRKMDDYVNDAVKSANSKVGRIVHGLENTGYKVDKRLEHTLIRLGNEAEKQMEGFLSLSKETKDEFLAKIPRCNIL